jgi:hypothetical protein
MVRRPPSWSGSSRRARPSVGPHRPNDFAHTLNRSPSKSSFRIAQDAAGPAMNRAT